MSGAAAYNALVSAEPIDERVRGPDASKRKAA